MGTMDRKMRISVLVAVVVVVAAQSALAVPDTDFEIVTPLQNKYSGKSETSVGDLVADAVRASLGADAAFVASSELKAKDEAIPAGKTSSAILAGLVSYADDTLTVVELSGATIRAALERAVGIYPQPCMAFLQVSGLKFSFEPTAPTGKRVTAITIRGQAIDDNVRYKVGMTTSLANGALGFWKVWPPDTIKKKMPDLTLIRAMDTYLKDNPRIDYPSADRISTKSR